MFSTTVEGKGKLARAVGAVLEGTCGMGCAKRAILAPDTYAEAASALQTLEPGTCVLCLAPLTPQEAALYAAACDEAGIAPLCGAIVGRYADLGSPASLAYSSGDRGAHQAFSDVLDTLGTTAYLGGNPAFAPLMAFTATGAHYASVLALYAGVGMCKRYGFPPDEFFRHMAGAIAPLSEGAYRNIWSGLASPDAFEDVDDVIHAMEMLVCLLKRTGAAALIEHDGGRQRRLNAMLRSHVDAIMVSCSGNEVAGHV